MAGPTPCCSPSVGCSRFSAARSQIPPFIATSCATSTPPWARAMPTPAGRCASISIRWRRGSGSAPPSVRWAASSRSPTGACASAHPTAARLAGRCRSRRSDTVQRRLLFLLPLLTLVLMAGFFAWSLMAGRDPASIGSVMVGRPAPRLDLPALEGGQPALSDATLKSGKTVLVNFFSSLCAPCLAEHPLFARLKEREGAVIIGIAWKNKREEALAWLTRLGDPFKTAGLDLDGKTGLDWGLSGVPETYAIDGNGIVRLHFRGPLTERDLNEAVIPFLKGTK